MADSNRIWHISLGGDQWIGPFSVEEVFDKIHQGEFSWGHFAWKKGKESWERLCDLKEFKTVAPSEPKSKPSIKAPSPPKQEKVWFLYYNDSQFGPFSAAEVEEYLRIGKIHGKVHIWRDGLTQWERLEKMKDFADSVKKSSPPPAPKRTAAATDKRGAPRQPLVAKILMAKQDQVIAGLCRDISVGGMQVLTDQMPGPAGTRIRLNVSPIGQKSIAPFVAEGVIVRILEDGRGFSFRFEKLAEAAKRTIEDYIHSR